MLPCYIVFPLRKPTYSTLEYIVFTGCNGRRSFLSYRRRRWWCIPRTYTSHKLIPILTWYSGQIVEIHICHFCSYNVSDCKIPANATLILYVPSIGKHFRLFILIYYSNHHVHHAFLQYNIADHSFQNSPTWTAVLNS
jgi:hypothetical protein